MKTIDDLQAELAAKIAKLDEERKEMSERHAQEQAERRIIEEADRAKRVAQIKADEEKHNRRKREQEEENIKRKQQEQADRIALEQKQNALDEVLIKQKEKLEWLEKAISDAEFVEEQHRKTLENSTVSTEEVVDSNEEINIEHPVAPLNSVHPGEAVDGTSGETPSSPLMSSHLKHILRQATRNY